MARSVPSNNAWTTSTRCGPTCARSGPGDPDERFGRLFDTDLTAAAAARLIDQTQLDAADDDDLAALVAQVEGLSEDELAALLAESE